MRACVFVCVYVHLYICMCQFYSRYSRSDYVPSLSTSLVNVTLAVAADDEATAAADVAAAAMSAPTASVRPFVMGGWPGSLR